MRTEFRACLVILLLLATSGAAQASDDRCLYEEWLRDLAGQSENLVAELSSGGVGQGAALAALLADHDSAALRRARLRDGYGGYAPQVARHVATARGLLAGRGGRAAQLAALQGSTAQLLAAVARVDCAARQVPMAAAGAEGGTRTASTSPSGGLRVMLDWTSVLAVLLGLLALGGVLLAERRTRSRKHRNQRFVCDIACSVRIGGAAHDSRIVDLSAAGAKLRLGLETAGELPVEITSEAFSTAGRVAWSNAHYCGVIFDRPLAPDALQAAVMPRAGAA